MDFFGQYLEQSVLYRCQAINLAKYFVKRLKESKPLYKEAFDRINSGEALGELKEEGFLSNTEHWHSSVLEKDDSVAYLPTFIQDYKGDNYKIITEFTDTPSDVVNAYCTQYEKDRQKSACITVQKHNHCQTRFYYSKELFQLAISSKDNETHIDDLETFIEELVNSVPASSSTMADWAAYCGALEYLIPSENVQMFREIRDLHQRNGAENANLDIAKILRVPEQSIEFRLNHLNDYLFNCPKIPNIN